MYLFILIFIEQITARQMVEAAFSKMVNNEETRFDFYKCRLAGVGGLLSNPYIVLVMMLMGVMVYIRR